MRLTILTFCAAFITQWASAQFPNGGFEFFSQLPNSIGQWSFSEDWSNCGSAVAHPDYYHVDGTLGGDLPQTPVAHVLPYEGKAIMGFAATGAPGTNRRVYLCTALETALQAGATYQVSFAITNGVITQQSFGGLGCSHLGLYFSTGDPSQTGMAPLSLQPQFKRQAVVYNREWERITFTFTADGNFTHMTLGVFNTDAEITINSFEGGSPALSYYFVDDFTMDMVPGEITEAEREPRTDVPPPSAPDGTDLIDTIEPTFFIPNAFTPNGDGDNDIFKPIVPPLQNYSFCVFSRWGELIFMSSDPEHGWDGTKAGDNVSTGMYIWELRYKTVSEDGSVRDEEHRGSVSLLR